MSDHEPQSECDGTATCKYRGRHIHGCFADRGYCDEPDEHAAAVGVPAAAIEKADIDAVRSCLSAEFTRTVFGPSDDRARRVADALEALDRIAALAAVAAKDKTT